MLPTKFQFIWPSSFRGEDLKNRPIRNKNCLLRPCLLMDQDKMSNLYRGPSIDASYQVSIHLAKRLQRRRFFRNNQSETRIVCGGHVCKRIGIKWAVVIEDLPRLAPTKFQFIWPSSFRGEEFLEINQSETRIAYGGHVCKWIGSKWAIFIGDLP